MYTRRYILPLQFVTFIKYGDHINEDEIGGACSTHATEKKCIKTLRRPLRTLMRKLKDNTVTCIPIAKQRVCKHIPAEANACNNRASIPRQRTSKHASLTKEAVFSASSVQSGNKEGFSWEELVVRSWVTCWELGRVLEMAVEGDWEEMARNELDCTKKTSCDLKLLWAGYKSVAWIQLVKTENPSACVTVNWKVCVDEQ
jgi:hypothetical protein